MRQEIIMVVAADLRWNESGIVIVGPETARVCDRAANVALDHKKALVYATAGWSKKYQVIMGQGPMRQALMERSVPPRRIRTPEAGRFNTNGEMHELVKNISWDQASEIEIFLVCRSWHLPRAWLLLRANLSREQRKKATVVPVPVKDSEDHRGMWLEGLAYLKNFFKLLKAF